MIKNNREKKFHDKDKRESLGVNTHLLNCNGEEIITGDIIKFKHNDYEGPVMWNRYQEAFGVFMGCWYGDPYKPDSYGKFIQIPEDNGMRMELIPVGNITTKER